MKYLQKIILTVFLIFSFNESLATHLRAGEILAKKTGSLQYEFTVIIYKNTDSPVLLDQVTLNFGDNTKQTTTVNGVSNINGSTDKYIFKFNKTYSSSGTYKVYIVEVNRNADIVNITNSVNVNFYLETQITINPYLGQNSSPEMKVPPIDNANTGQIFTHNPGAWDADGDSLAFTLGVPKYVPNDTAETAPGYRALTDPAFSTSKCNSTLSLDPKKGDLVWNTPCVPGLYNIAIIIEEYRNGRLIGFITRDMQINVLQNTNEPPKLIIPNDTCITAGTLLKNTISATDSPFSTIEFSAYSGVFQLSSSPALISYPLGKGNIQTVPATMYFTWQTTCDHIRKEAYNIQFKAEDVPQHISPTGLSDQLATIKTWSINIVAPKVDSLSATTLNKTITLNWKKYSCNNASKIHIMRKDCPSDSSAIDSCSSGVSTSDGFVEVGSVKTNETTFTDAKDLRRGAVYCYRLYAEFPEPTKGKSRQSNELCVTLSLDVPIIFKVSVDSINGTSKTDGKIDIAWTLPRKLDSTLYPPPYSYELWRMENNNALQASLIKQSIPFIDTTYTDTKLNTYENTYTYFVKFIYASNKLKENTDTASTVRLNGYSKNKRVILNWNFNVPWDNIGKYNYILRANDSTFALIDSVRATSNKISYTDHGKYMNAPLENGKKYTYYITTLGDYTCPDQVKRVNLPYLLSNNSQRISVIPSDTNRPCPPILTIVKINCNEKPIIPKIYWKPNLETFCDSAITSYNIYYSLANQKDFTLLTKVNSSDTSFKDMLSNRSSTACYYVTAYNSETNMESKPSNIVCSDAENCGFNYDFPNVFTPNEDGSNDTFRPLEPIISVKSVDIKIYNKWGVLVFSTSDIYVNWDAKNIPDGLYYYTANVITNTNQKNNKHGWFQLIR